MEIRRRGGRALAAAVLGALLWAGAVRAHAGYVRSEPGAGAVVAAVPDQVEIWFSQDMFRRQGENWITVTGPTGDPAHAGDAAIDDDDRRRMSVALQADLPPGDYTVAWRTLSAEDGDDDEGVFIFTLDPEAQVTSTPMSAATPAVVPQPSATPALAPPSPTPASASSVGCGFGLAPAVGLVVAGALGLSARKRRSRP